MVNINFIVFSFFETLWLIYVHAVFKIKLNLVSEISWCGRAGELGKVASLSYAFYIFILGFLDASPIFYII